MVNLLTRFLLALTFGALPLSVGSAANADAGGFRILENGLTIESVSKINAKTLHVRASYRNPTDRRICVFPAANASFWVEPADDPSSFLVQYDFVDLTEPNDLFEVEPVVTRVLLEPGSDVTLDYLLNTAWYNGIDHDPRSKRSPRGANAIKLYTVRLQNTVLDCSASLASEERFLRMIRRNSRSLDAKSWIVRSNRSAPVKLDIDVPPPGSVIIME